MQTKAAADDFERILRKDFLDRERQGADPFAQAPTFADFAEQWFSGHVARCRPATRYTVRWLLDTHLVPAFGPLRINDITTERIDVLKSRLSAKGLGASSINTIIGILRACLSRAVKWGRLGSVPLIEREKPRPPSDDFLLPEESARLLDALQETYWHAFVHLLLETGVRFGEAAALRWENVRLDGPVPQIAVKRNYSRDEAGPPKNNRFRDVPLTAALVRTLRALPRTDELVFPTHLPASKLSPRANLRIEQACRRAGLRRMSCHKMRHTYASQLVMAGVSLRTVQMLLGHSSIKQTERYAHLAPDALDSAARAVQVLDRNPGGHQARPSGDFAAARM